MCSRRLQKCAVLWLSELAVADYNFNMNAYVELLRPSQWIKNVSVLVALPFALLQPNAGARAAVMLIAAAAFCLASSAIYAVNDVIDRAEDLAHPMKKLRPVARGAIPPGAALCFAVFLAAAASACGLLTHSSGLIVMLWCYLVLMLFYSAVLKHQPILDVIVIATGFVLRAVAGAISAHVFISPWLIACTFTLCLFLGFGKRRSEIYAINDKDDAALHRSTLPHYSADLLNQLLSTSAGVALITFMLYAMDKTVRPGQPDLINKEPLLYTLPLVAYGLFRYAMLIESGKVQGPTDIILKDRTLLVIILLWLVCCSVIVLWDPILDSIR